MREDVDPVLRKRKKRDSDLRRKYGITIEQYDELLKKQGGGCGLCGKTPEEEGKSLAVDHNHVTNEIRGVLCSYCNHRIIGRHRDPTLLRRMAEYVESTTGWFVPRKKKNNKEKGEKIMIEVGTKDHKRKGDNEFDGEGVERKG